MLFGFDPKSRSQTRAAQHAFDTMNAPYWFEEVLKSEEDTVRPRRSWAKCLASFRIRIYPIRRSWNRSKIGRILKLPRPSTKPSSWTEWDCHHYQMKQLSEYFRKYHISRRTHPLSKQYVYPVKIPSYSCHYADFPYFGERLKRLRE